MIKYLTIVFVFFCASLSSQVISMPSFKFRTNHSLNINSIKRTKKSTVISFTHNAPVAYENGGWIYIGGGIKLVDTVNNLTYHLVSFSGIDTTESNRFFYKNKMDSISFTLTFEPLDKKTKCFNILECESDKCFNFYGVSLTNHFPFMLETNKIREYYPNLTLQDDKISTGVNTFIFNNNRFYGFTVAKADGTKEKFTPIDRAVYNVNANGKSIIEYPVKDEKGNGFVFALIDYEVIIFSYSDKNLEFSK